MEPWQLTDATTGATGAGQFDPNDPLTFFTVAGRSMENQGREASIPGWTESRYFGTRADYEHFKKWQAETAHWNSQADVATWFTTDSYGQTTNGRWWNEYIGESDRERLIYQAGQRIQKTYLGDLEARWAQLAEPP